MRTSQPIDTFRCGARGVALALAGAAAAMSTPVAARATQGSCTYIVSPASAAADPAGSRGAVTVTAQAGCAWTASSAETWIIITSGSAGSGSGSVTYRTLTNGGAARNGSLSVAGQQVPVSQAVFTAAACDAGVTVTNLSPPAANDADPAWSSDGSRIVFSAPESAWRTLWTMRPDGTDRQRLTTVTNPLFQFDVSPAWMPADRVAFCRQTNAGTQTFTTTIRTIAPDGTGERFVVAPTGGPFPVSIACGPAWSPTIPRRLAYYATYSTTTADRDLFVVNADGSGAARVGPSTPAASDQDPVWMPDGQALVFERVTAAPQSMTIHRVGLDGSGLAPLTDQSMFVTDPSVSPDGARIAFMRRGADPQTDYLYLMHADGTNMCRLTTQPASAKPKWSPDGRRIVFISGSMTRAIYVTSPLDDLDADALPDVWERQFGLDTTSATGADGPVGDPDGDGLTNAQELQQGRHPRGFFSRYFAEGATGPFFDTLFALVNPAANAATHVNLFFNRSDGTTANLPVTLGPVTRATVNAKADVPALTAAEFSTIVEADLPVVADRTMTWDARGYGAHAETSVAAPATRWYLAEGATHSGFNLFYLLQNPSATAAAAITVTYLLPGGGTLQRPYTVGPNSRFNIWVNGIGPLASTDVSAIVDSTLPIIVERAMYLNLPGQPFGAGHESAGVTAPQTSWFLAEGATGLFFDLFLLIANPNASATTVTARYLLASGTVLTKTYTVPGNSRFNIWVDQEEIPAGSGQRPLADVAVSTTVTATLPIIVERAMWWPGPTASTWYEAHNSPGSTVTGTKWALAEGEVDAAAGIETYVLIANTSAQAGSVRVTLLFEDGTTQEKTYGAAEIRANSRFNVAVASEFPTSAGRRFGVIVESLGATPAQLVVERAMYYTAGGVVWAAGTNSLATKLQ